MGLLVGAILLLSCVKSARAEGPVFAFNGLDRCHASRIQVEPGLEAVGGLAAPTDRLITVSCADQSISFAFAPVDDTATLRYRYQLVGHDATWTDVPPGEHVVTYVSLDPGDYQFRIETRGADGSWSEQAFALPVEIVPPWSQTSWFRGLLFLLVIGSVWGIQQVHTQFIQEQNRRLSSQVAERTAELSTRTDELAQTNARLESEIAERLRIEAALRTSEELYRDVVQSQTELVCRYRPDLALTFVNDAYCRYFDQPRARLLGRNLLEFVPPDQHERVRRHLRTLQQNPGPTEFEYPVQTPAGERRWHHWTGHAISNDNGQIREIQSVGIDITERKEAEEATRTANEQLATMLVVSRSILSTFDLEPLLDLILEQLGRVIDYHGAAIFSRTGDAFKLEARRIAHGAPEQPNVPPPMESVSITAALHADGRAPFILDDARDAPAAAQLAGAVFGERAPRCSIVGAPLVVKGEMTGFLIICHRQPGYYSRQDMQLAQVFANQVAVALENARLFRQAEQAARSEERSRLARDLHDAVVQTLFSASLIANSLPDVWRRSPEAGQAGLKKLTELTRSAIGEMRALLHELRPEALLREPLGEILRPLCEATRNRAQISLELVVENDCELPPDVQINLYRIAQEALNNVVKHADATQATVELSCHPTCVTLRVTDDGQGFDPHQLPGDRLGISIMQERTDEIGATLHIRSQRDLGTQIEVVWAPSSSSSPSSSRPASRVGDRNSEGPL